ncbi:MAG: SufD family Fe-S cluster assembly protein [Nanoarchaeota archaeon]
MTAVSKTVRLRADELSLSASRLHDNVKYGLQIRGWLTSKDVEAKDPDTNAVSYQVVRCKPDPSTVVSFDKVPQAIDATYCLTALGDQKAAMLIASKATDGRVIYARKGQAIRVSLDASQRKPVAFERISIIAQTDAILDVILDSAGPGEARHQVIEIVADQGSKVTLTHVVRSRADTFSCWVSGIVHGDASVMVRHLQMGACDSRVHGSIRLAGRGAQGSWLAGSLLARSHRSDHAATIVHEDKDTHSDMRMRCILLDSSRQIAQGDIHILPGAGGSAGKQRIESLLLSDDAIVTPIPNLRIETDDVTCSHGATVGRLDESAMFYMMSRGLPRPAAERLVIEGFFAPLVNAQDHDIMDRVQGIIKDTISRPEVSG